MILLRKLNMVLLFVLAMNALLAGYLFMLDPSGKYLGISTVLLRHSPFDNYFIPGLVLFTVNGLLAVFTGLMLARQWRGGPFWLVVQGVLLSGWIFVQVLMLRELNVLHFTFGAIGLFFFGSGIYLFRKTEKV